MLSQEKIERINELSRRSKTKGLSDEEAEEQQNLRQEYLQKFRSSFKSQMEGVRVVDPEGQDVTPAKLKRVKGENNRGH
ncbi:DUF896 domain-containing protein [Salsuginibacillus kocurii]|uniref:DUF896 domain-containing protein n=1 Tax=Salsuginibacillus kocurii TaxID=427078 RepID=UPI00037FC250|nr:DUF896 domain-containing protein [Salsuginibacillus kocurii]